MDRRITTLADRTARRLQWRRTLDDLRLPVILLGAVILVLALYDRWPGGPRVNWWWACGVLGAGVVIWLIAELSRRRCSRLEGAIVLDERLETRDVFSTALAVPEDEDQPMTVAMHAHAAACAQKVGARHGPRRAVPMSCPEGWWWGLLLLVPALALLMFDPLPGRAATTEDPQDLVVARADAVEAVSMVQQQLDSSPELAEAIGMDSALQSHQALDDAAAVRRETLRDLTELSKRLEMFQNGTRSQGVDEVRKRLQEVAPGGNESGGADIRRAMAQGDLESMADAIERIRTDRADGGDADEETAGDLEALAAAVRSAASDNQALADAMKGAGLDPALADQPDALDEAVARSEHLSMQQKEDLESLGQSQKQAGESLEELAEELDTLAGQCRNSGPAKEQGSKPSTKQSESSKSPSQCQSKSLAKRQRAQRQAGQCQSACQSGGEKAGGKKAGQSTGRGTQTGGKGKGSGQLAADGSAAVNFNRTRVRSEVNTSAPVISSSHVKADTVRGTAQATPGTPMQQAQRRLEDGVDVKAVPRRYRDAVAAWFSSLKAPDASDEDETQDEDDQESGGGGESGGGSEDEGP